MFGDANSRIDGTHKYSYGIDKAGKMYIYNLGTNKMTFYGDPSKGFAEVYVLQSQGNEFKPFEGDQRKTAGGQTQLTSDTGGGGGGFASPAKVLDQAQLDSLESLLGGYDGIRDTSKKKAGTKRDTSLKEKEEEKKREQGKYDGKKLETLQDFAGAKTDTDINTRNTLENLISSLSTLGLGGSRALTRQILDAANISNRKANATQAKNNQGLDSAFNEFTVGNENDVNKIHDQYDYEVGEADRVWGQNKQNTLYKMADVYNAADDAGNRERLMKEGNSLNKFITDSAFLNPRYTGVSREMVTPELADYTQSIGRYDTSAIGGVTPVGGGAQAPGNLAVRAISVNDKDFGVKKKNEGEVGYGV